MTRTLLSVGASLLLLLAHPRAQDQVIFTDQAAENLFRYSRMAVNGSGAAVTRLRALVFKGRSRILADNGTLMPASVEIKLLLPDHYLRIDTIGGSEKLAGYAGNTVLSAIRAGNSVSYPPESLLKSILENGRQYVARLLLGAATYVTADRVLTFHSVPKSVEMVDPRVSARTTVTVDTSGNLEPYTANVTGDRFDARFIVDGTSHAPSRIVYLGGDKAEITLSFEDRRGAGGMQLPYHITTTSRGKTLDELLFDEILVNPEIGKNDFNKNDFKK